MVTHVPAGASLQLPSWSLKNLLLAQTTGLFTNININFTDEVSMTTAMYVD